MAPNRRSMERTVLRLRKLPGIVSVVVTPAGVVEGYTGSACERPAVCRVPCVARERGSNQGDAACQRV